MPRPPPLPRNFRFAFYLNGYPVVMISLLGIVIIIILRRRPPPHILRRGCIILRVAVSYIPHCRQIS